MNEYDDVARIVNNRLKLILGEQRHEQFKKALCRSDGVLSGSFIVQCILEESWPDSDIDVFLPGGTLASPEDNPYSPLEQWFVNLGCESAIYPIEEEEYYEFAVHGKITAIRECRLDSHRFQLIYTDLPTGDAVSNFITHDFDFSIVQNTFRIKKDGTMCCCVTNMQGIVKRQFAFTYGANIVTALERSIKYEERGFFITMDRKDILDNLQRANIVVYFWTDFWTHSGTSPVPMPEKFKGRRFDSNVEKRHPAARKIDMIREFEKVESPPKCDCDSKRCIFTVLTAAHFHINCSPGRAYERVFVDPCINFSIMRAAQIAFALQSLELPALLTCMIIDEACPFAKTVKMHTKWTLAVLVKKFYDKKHAPLIDGEEMEEESE